MGKIKIIGVFVSFILLLCVARTSGTEPYSKNAALLNASQNWRSVHIPGRCPDGELLYIYGEQEENAGECDCQEGFVYYPPKQKCYQVYRQGPCQKNQYLILPKNEVIPTCVNNPCRKDTMVPFRNGCYKLNKKNACQTSTPGDVLILATNVTTLELQCVPQSTVALSIAAGIDNCKGSKRAQDGNCRESYG